MTVANVIDVMTDDQHCNSCALGKAKMPATPTGKTIRPSRKVVNSKMYVDLSGTLRKHRSTMVFTIIVTCDGRGTQFTCFTSTKVQVLTPEVCSRSSPSS